MANSLHLRTRLGRVHTHAVDLHVYLRGCTSLAGLGSELDQVPAEDVWALFVVAQGMAMKLAEEIALIDPADETDPDA